MAQCLSLPADLEVRSCPESGRGLYAKVAVPRGSMLLCAQPPLAHVARGDIRHQVCQSCFKRTDGKLLKCGSCKFVYYCDGRCQKEDWQCHKSECAGVKRIREEVSTAIPSNTMLLVARLVTVTRKSKSKREQLDYLSNRSYESEQSRKDLPYLVMGVASLLGDTSEVTRSAIADILAKVDANTFHVMDATHEESVGVALYGPASLVNHSCAPNSLAVFNGRELTLRAMAPLQPGDQVLISYTELMESREQRQAHLMKGYSFLCACPRCHVEESESSPWKLMYEKSNASVSEELKLSAMQKGFSLIDDTLKELEKALDWTGIVERCCSVVAECEEVLHPLNVVLTCIRQQLMRAQFNMEDWPAALEIGQLLTPAYKKFLPDWHPVLIIHLIKMAKLHRLLATDHHSLQRAVLELEEAQKHLPLILGGGSSLESQVSAMLSDTRRELQQCKAIT